MGWQDDDVVSTPQRATPPKRSRTFIEDANALGNVTNDWLSFGLSDDGAGLGNVIGNVLRPPFNPLKGLPDPQKNPIRPLDVKGAFSRGKAAYQRETERAKKEMPNASRVAAGVGIAGSLAMPLPGGRKAQTFWDGAKSAAKFGGVYGGISGVGNSDGNALERVGSGLLGAGAGALAGPVLYGAATGIASLFGSAKRLAGVGKAPPVAPQMIAEALQSDGLTPGLAGRRIADARARGVPLALMDVGDNARGLGASVGRHPGPSKTIVTDMVAGRQQGQADRLTGAIERDLGPVVNPRQQSEQLIQQARTAAAPLYDAAFAAPGRTSDELEALLQTPAGRAALGRARTIAANERVDPNKLGFGLDDQGEVVLTSVPSARTVDYVKRGLDDILETGRDKVTGRMNYDEYLRSVEAVRAGLVREADRLNPAYGQARAAYAGPASANEALRLGQSALNMPARDIEAAVARMSPAELSQFQLGYRIALSDKINKAGDYGDKVRLLANSPEKRRALAAAFGSEEGLDNFARTIADEELAQRSYQAVAGNSATAGRQLVDQATGDTGLASSALDSALATGGDPVSATVGFLGGLIRKARDNRVGKLGEETRGQIAAALAETDPAILREALRQAQRARAIHARGARVNEGVARATGIAGGRMAAGMVSPSDVPRGTYYDPETGGLHDARTGAPVPWGARP